MQDSGEYRKDRDGSTDDCSTNYDEEPKEFRELKEEIYERIVSQAFLFLILILVLVILAVITARIRDGPKEVERRGSLTNSTNLQIGGKNAGTYESKFETFRYVHDVGVVSRWGISNFSLDGERREI